MKNIKVRKVGKGKGKNQGDKNHEEDKNQGGD